MSVSPPPRPRTDLSSPVRGQDTTQPRSSAHSLPHPLPTLGGSRVPAALASRAKEASAGHFQLKAECEPRLTRQPAEQTCGLGRREGRFSDPGPQFHRPLVAALTPPPRRSSRAHGHSVERRPHGPRAATDSEKINIKGRQSREHPSPRSTQKYLAGTEKPGCHRPAPSGPQCRGSRRAPNPGAAFPTSCTSLRKER